MVDLSNFGSVSLNLDFLHLYFFICLLDLKSGSGSDSESWSKSDPSASLENDSDLISGSEKEVIFHFNLRLALDPNFSSYSFEKDFKNPFI